MAKPKNGSLEPAVASAKWLDLCNAPGALTDNGGTSDKYRKRVAVDKRSLVTFRDQTVRSKGFELIGHDVKNPNAENIDAMHNKMSRKGFTSGVAGMQSMMDTAMAMVNAQMAEEEGGGQNGSFGEAGRAMMAIPDVRGILDPDAETGEPGAGEEAPPSAAEAEGPAKRKVDPDGGGTPGKKAKAEQPKWFDASKITEALSTHAQWMKEKSASLEDQAAESRAAMAKVTPEIAVEVDNELNLLKTKYRALRLVMSSQSKPNTASSPSGHAKRKEKEAEAISAADVKATAEAEKKRVEAAAEAEEERKSVEAATGGGGGAAAAEKEQSLEKEDGVEQRRTRARSKREDGNQDGKDKDTAQEEAASVVAGGDGAPGHFDEQEQQ